MKTEDMVGDEELRAGLAEKLDDSFPRFVLAYQDRLFGFALRLVGNPRDAEEIAQDAFVRAYRALRGYPAERTRDLALKPWLYRITLNLCRNRLRGRRPTVLSIDRAMDDESDGFLDIPDAESGRPEALFEQREEHDNLSRLLAALPERYREAVVLRFVQGSSYAEVAAILKQPVGTVKSNVHRGVRLLREGLAEQERTRSQLVEVRR